MSVAWNFHLTPPQGGFIRIDMMYLILSGIFAATSFAQAAPLLTLYQSPVHTQPEYAREVHCTLENNHVISKITKGLTTEGWQTVTNIDQVVSDSDLLQIQTWINEAAIGPFKQGTAPCDVRQLNIVTETYPLILSESCGRRIENLNPSAAKIINWLYQACIPEGFKQ